MIRCGIRICRHLHCPGWVAGARMEGSRFGRRNAFWVGLVWDEVSEMIHRGNWICHYHHGPYCVSCLLCGCGRRGSASGIQIYCRVTGADRCRGVEAETGLGRGCDCVTGSGTGTELHGGLCANWKGRKNQTHGGVESHGNDRGCGCEGAEIVSSFDNGQDLVFLDHDLRVPASSGPPILALGPVLLLSAVGRFRQPFRLQSKCNSQRCCSLLSERGYTFSRISSCFLASRSSLGTPCGFSWPLRHNDHSSLQNLAVSLSRNPVSWIWRDLMSGYYHEGSLSA